MLFRGVVSVYGVEEIGPMEMCDMRYTVVCLGSFDWFIAFSSFLLMGGYLMYHTTDRVFVRFFLYPRLSMLGLYITSSFTYCVMVMPNISCVLFDQCRQVYTDFHDRIFVVQGPQ